MGHCQYIASWPHASGMPAQPSWSPAFGSHSELKLWLSCVHTNTECVGGYAGILHVLEHKLWNDLHINAVTPVACAVTLVACGHGSVLAVEPVNGPFIWWTRCPLLPGNIWVTSATLREITVPEKRQLFHRYEILLLLVPYIVFSALCMFYEDEDDKHRLIVHILYQLLK